MLKEKNENEMGEQEPSCGDRSYIKALDKNKKSMVASELRWTGGYRLEIHIYGLLVMSIKSEAIKGLCGRKKGMVRVVV